MRPAAWRVGFFALAGLALVALAVVLLGGNWFAASERGVMRFDRSVYGLQVGAPVVLRGVRVGQVVTVAPALVARGLVALLATQSLLPGLLYIDLDIDPARAVASTGTPASGAAGTLPVIPTQATRLQTLQSQLEGLDLAQIGRDLSAVAASTRQLLGGPEAAQLLARRAAAAASGQQLAQTMQREVGPLARSAEATLAESRRAVQQIAPAAQQLAMAAAQMGAAASQTQALAAAGLPMVAQVQRMSAELGQAAVVLREAAAEDSALRLNADRALQDVARAARSLREVAELLERPPDAPLR